LRIYSAEAWAKYTGATPYDQDLHRNYLNQTVLVPSTADRYQQLEMFVFLVDVPEELGPPHLVPRTHTADLPMNPNFYPPSGGRGDFVSTGDHADLYAMEQSMHLNCRPADVDWGQRMAWAGRSHMPEWYRFVHPLNNLDFTADQPVEIDRFPVAGVGINLRSPFSGARVLTQSIGCNSVSSN